MTIRAGRAMFITGLVPVLLAACGVVSPGEARLPPGTQECIGLDQGQCAQVLRSIAGNPNARPVAWRIRCTSVCDRESGDVEMTITWSDGRTETSGMGWAGALEPGFGPPPPAAPIPTPQVPPTCVAVPAEQCAIWWAQANETLTEEQRTQVVRVLIECTTTCTLLEGEGRTTLLLQDGTRIQPSTWGY